MHFDALKIMHRREGGESGETRVALLGNMARAHGRFSSYGGINSVLGSHDQIGDRHDGCDDNRSHRYAVSRWGGRNNWHARAQVRMWHAFQTFSKGLPMTFMGTETLQDGWWHVDARSRFNWALASDPLGLQMRACVRSANLLRRQFAAFTSENLSIVHKDATHTVVGFTRWADPADARRAPDEPAAFLVVINASESQWEKPDYGVSVGGSEGSWQLCFNTQEEVLGGWSASCISSQLRVHEGRIFINLPKWSVVVFKYCG
jgi:1,4-alpha-glucan branching enzyme